VVAVGKTLASDAVEKVVILAQTCRTVLVDTSAVSLASTIEGATDRTTRDEEVAGIAVAGQWVTGALGDGSIE
jgi:uncharacterized membrane protein